MAYEKLKNLANSYPCQDGESLKKLAGKYRRRHEREVLALAAIAADVGIDNVTNLGLEPDTHPRLLEAFNLYSPNMSIDTLKDTTEEQLQGYANGVKGKYFEVLVKDKLNDGESVGGIQLVPGQKAVLAESPTQPGWDLKIVDEAGEPVEELQLKATDAMASVREALNKYPDIRVIVPLELKENAAADDDIIASNISDEYMEDIADKDTLYERLSATKDELSEGIIEDLTDKGAEFAVDAFPVFSAAIIVVSEGKQVLIGRSTVQEALKQSKGRLTRAGAYTTIGAALTATGIGAPIAIPTVAALRVAEGRVRHRAAMGRHVEEKTQEILRETARRPGP